MSGEVKGMCLVQMQVAGRQVRTVRFWAQRVHWSATRGTSIPRTLEVPIHDGCLCPRRKSRAKSRGQAAEDAAGAGLVSKLASWHSFVPQVL